MSATTNVDSLIEKLKTLSKEERQCCLRLYLIRTPGPFYFTMKSHPKTLTSLRLTKYELTFENFKYKILTTIVDRIRSMNGVIDTKCKLQLSSDLRKSDILELCYHLFKDPPTETLISELIDKYNDTFDDNFIEATAAFTLNGNKYCQILSCNKAKNIFKNPQGTMLTIQNTYNMHKVLQDLRDRIDESFIVNTQNKNKKNIDTFIANPEKPPIIVETYNNFILKLVNTK
ncbi:hypothetical protein CsNV_038 [Callinectes sapidus nudivirus]|nr:hypothetical protein CsNV_038 [Callinectes sapidus nudivirus]